MRSIRSGKGIGDNLYLQAIVRHLVGRGERLEVCTDWPDIFRPLAGKIDITPHRRLNVDLVSHYTTRKALTDTDQFEDCCLTAGVPKDIDLRLDWSLSSPWPANVFPKDMPIILIQLPRHPFNRTDGYAIDLLPRCEVIQRAIDKIGDRAFIVQVGSGKPLYSFSRVHLDLADKTSVAQLIDAGFVADGFLGYCSFFVPLAESFSKPALFVWSRRGLKSHVPYLNTIMPQKILHRQSSRFAIDDCSDQELAESVDALLEQAGIAASLRRQAGCDSRQRAGGS